MNKTFKKTKYKDLHCSSTMDFKIGQWNPPQFLAPQIFIESLTMFRALFYISGAN